MWGVRSKQFRVLGLATGLLASGTIAAIADDDGPPTGIPDPSIATSLPPGLRDPGGIRAGLAGQGITYGANYIADVLGNVSGGVEQSTHYTGLLELYSDVDVEKLAGWHGLSFHISGYQIHGTSISGENLGSLAAVSNIEAFPSTRLVELWFEQKLLDDMLSVRFGQLFADAEFFVAEGGGAFIASTFGWTTISSDNIPVGGPIYPIPTRGVRLAFEPNVNLNLMAGLWNGDPVGPCPDDLDPGQCNEDGFDFRLKDPPLAIAEAAYSYNKESGLAGTVKIGGWRHWGDFDDQRRDDAGGLQAVSDGNPLQRDKNYGIYGVIDQMLFRLPGDGDRSVSMFARVAGSPEDRNQIDFYIDGGLVIAGPFASRPSDVLGVALAYSGISEDASGLDRDSGAAIVRDHETVLEISYTAEIVSGLTLQPDFQYFWNPGGRVEDPARPGKAVEDAAVFGLRTSVSY